MRPSDWSALDLGSDPVPGESGKVLSGGRDYLAVADAIKDAGRKLRTLAQSARSAADSASNDKQHYLRLAADEHDTQQTLSYTNLADGLDSDAAGAHAHLANAQGRVHDAMSARDRAAQSSIEHIHASPNTTDFATAGGTTGAKTCCR